MYCCVSRETQLDASEIEKEGLEYVDEIRGLMNGPHKSPYWLINMDQTLIYYHMTPNKSFIKKEAKTVSIKNHPEARIVSQLLLM